MNCRPRNAPVSRYKIFSIFFLESKYSSKYFMKLKIKCFLFEGKDFIMLKLCKLLRTEDMCQKFRFYIKCATSMTTILLKVLFVVKLIQTNVCIFA